MGLRKILNRRSGKVRHGDHDVHPAAVATSPAKDAIQSAPLISTIDSDALLKPHQDRHALGHSILSGSWKPDDSDAGAPIASSGPRFQPGNSRPDTATSMESAATTNTEHARTAVRPKREQRKPPVSFRKPSSLASTVDSFQESLVERGRAIDVQSIEQQPRRRSDSTTSLGRSKDILDAQEEIRAVDFRTRVHASGARDYGEDVADRNIAKNRRKSLHAKSSPDLKSHYFSEAVPPTRILLDRAGSRTSSNRTQSLSASSLSPHTAALQSGKQHRDRMPLREAPLFNEVRVAMSFSGRNRNRLSLNTYVPTTTYVAKGLASPYSPRSSIGSSPLQNAVLSREVGTPDSTLGIGSRNYHISPTGSNFSVPRSPKHQNSSSRPTSSRGGHLDQDAEGGEEQNSGDMFGEENSHNRRKSRMSLSQFSLSKVHKRLSYQTSRSSVLSMVASRYPSVELTPLSAPKFRESAFTVHNSSIPRDYSETRKRTKSLSTASGARVSWSSAAAAAKRQSGSSGHSRSKSDDGPLDHQRSKNSGVFSSPFGLMGLSEIEEKSPLPRPSSAGDSGFDTLSNAESTTSSSNIYSRTSGRPHSRYTKATSIDSTNRPDSSCRSEDSIISETYSQTPLSPSTMRSPGFNIDDYISSDDDSFTTERKPRKLTSEGEEDLLFKSGFGVTGAALPGLLESPIDAACPPPVVRDNRRSRFAAAAAADDGDASNVSAGRFSVGEQHSPRTSADLPWGRTAVDPTMDGTFGRTSASVRRSSGGNNNNNNRSMSNASLTDGMHASHWSDNSDSENEAYEERRATCRGQKRLSAFGALQQQQQYRRNSHFSNASQRSVTQPHEEEEDNEQARANAERAAAVMRAIKLRKEDKARKRAAEAARNSELRVRRLTRAFGDMSDDVAAAAATVAAERGEDGEAERGRKLVR